MVVTTAVTTSNSYIVRVPGRSGYYFQRRCPADCKDKLKRVMWRFKLSNDLLEARRMVLEALLATDRQIAEVRGDTAALIKLADESQRTSAGLAKAMQEWQVSATDIYPRLPEEAAEALVERQIKVEAGELVDHSFDALIDLCQRLKQPAPTTLIQWKQRMKELRNICSVNDVTKVTESDARKYRDHQLSNCAGTTTKNRIKYLKALFTMAKEEGWIKTSPWDAIILKRIKGTYKKKEVKHLNNADKVVEKGVLQNNSELVYWICRYTGTHVSEAAGMVHGDIDLTANIIHIRENELRPIKNDYRERELPITSRLREKIEQLYQPGTEGKHISPGFYDAKGKRWGGKLQWSRLIGISPKMCRDTAATTMRDSNINERVIGAILGHVPVNSTGVYGAVSMEAKKEALEMIS